MAEWSVMIEAKANEELALDDPRIDQLMDLLTPSAGAVAFGGPENVVAVTMSAEGHDALEASHWAATELSLLLEKVDLSVGPVSRLEAVESDVLSAELEESSFPDIVGTTEAAEMLGVSRQRLHQLRAAGTFPEPMITLAATPIWMRQAIEAFLKRWPRLSGRPRLSP